MSDNSNENSVGDIVLIVDTSTGQNISACTEYINLLISSQKKNFPDSLFTLITFNDRHRYIFMSKSIQTITEPISEEDLISQGSCKLYDNVCAILIHLHRFYATVKQRAPIVIILSAGKDNSVITEQKHLAICIARSRYISGWKYIFLSSEDQLQTGIDIGCDITGKIDWLDFEKSVRDLQRVMESIGKDK